MYPLRIFVRIVYSICSLLPHWKDESNQKHKIDNLLIHQLKFQNLENNEHDQIRYKADL